MDKLTEKGEKSAKGSEKHKKICIYKTNFISLQREIEKYDEDDSGIYRDIETTRTNIA